jgi:Zn-dependent M28 family amino/carboxypeptidase
MRDGSVADYHLARMLEGRATKGNEVKISTRLALPIAAALLIAACAGGSDAETTTDTATVDSAPGTEVATTEVADTEPEAPATDPPATDPPVTEAPEAEPEEDDEIPTAEEIVRTLADDEFNGRDNLTPESEAVQALLVETLEGIAEPANPDGSYLQPYGEGTNVIGLIPGSGALADEYVMVGAHYDHHGVDCNTLGLSDDIICNGAADNAAGVAAALLIATDFATTDPAVDGERSMIIALWDGEEDGLVGSRAYVANPLIPLEQTVAYVNFDIQGVNLLPSLSNTTILVGPETGGQPLIDAANAATAASPLDYATFSLIFGQGRSDHATLVEAGVPSVFFTDANNGCYHTVLDDADHVDYAKLDHQIGTANALTRELLLTTTPPVLVTDAPLSTYSDAEHLLRVVQRGESDLGLLPDGGVAATQLLIDLQAIVDAGPDAYDDAAGGAVLGGAAALVTGLANSECLPI